VNDPNYDIKKHGESVYTAYCQSCHGTGGTNGAGGADLTISQMNMKTMTEQIKNGSSTMAGFKDVLNEQEVNAVVVYVLTLKK
jgi:mono/diheme cytochrome c family protein